ncbi:hypothetical protein MJ_0562 [Methanocaldococcus jannaschii DSM 2661]|uniref:Uncharacterized protein MJ0562 n=2 Tax=Methanocaldococcus jannaschii TaxID=2190 RepID=Y562_METJA|nr:RecName: Full=Uncharacterized protein MJ0562 [Methanocaldococcus jannaschii DSM 2661]AAB98560.1 hypothetical protein MJ_0562 [Methanocaldococcus jannaschii DSM 2661]
MIGMNFKDPIEELLDNYFNAKKEYEKNPIEKNLNRLKKAEAKLMINYPNTNATYIYKNKKYKIIIKDSVSVIPI